MYKNIIHLFKNNKPVCLQVVYDNELIIIE